MNYHFQAKNSQIHMPSDFARQAFKKHLANNEGSVFDIVKRTPEESRSQRSFYHGAVLKLWIFLDGKDYKNNDLVARYHEIAKLEFNGDFEVSNGKTYRIGKSTRQALNNGFLERVIDNLVTQYGIDQSVVLNPKLYKKWKTEIWPYGGPETFIDYMLSIRILK